MSATNEPKLAPELKDAMNKRVLSLIRKPQAEQKKKKAVNKAPLARWGFNGTMLFLDFISGWTVGTLTNWYYGFLTFLAGFLALIIWEELFTNAHANMHQKWIAIGGGAIAVISTLSLGILAGIANVLSVGLVPVATIGISMIIALVVMAFTHGILWGVYYFTDPTHVAEMKRIVNIAYREQQVQGLEEAKEDLAQVKAIARELEGYEKSGDLEALTASFESMRGTSLLNDTPAPTSVSVNAPDPHIAVEAGVGFVPKEAVLPPLPTLEEKQG
jgi:hypothetical protein